jgi:hypothetical protein
MVNYLLFIAAFIMRFQPFYAVYKYGFPPRPDEFINYETPMFAIIQWKNIMSVNCVVSWLRLFKYLQEVPFMQVRSAEIIEHDACAQLSLMRVRGEETSGEAPHTNKPRVSQSRGSCLLERSRSPCNKWFPSSLSSSSSSAGLRWPICLPSGGSLRPSALTR